MMSRPDAPARTVLAHQGAKGGQIMLGNDRHPPSPIDAPAYAITASGDRGAQGGYVLDVSASRPTNGGAVMRLDDPNRPPAPLDAPHRTIGTTEDQALLELPRPLRGARLGDPDRPGEVVTTEPARIGAGPRQTKSWPWDVPSTTVNAQKRLAPPGHHPESGSILSQPNAIVLSERAAAILQGFPDGWQFVARTKEARWSMLGQAMPPGLAHAVAVAVVEQLAAAGLGRDPHCSMCIRGIDHKRHDDGSRAA